MAPSCTFLAFVGWTTVDSMSHVATADGTQAKRGFHGLRHGVGVGLARSEPLLLWLFQEVAFLNIHPTRIEAWEGSAKACNNTEAEPSSFF